METVDKVFSGNFTDVPDAEIDLFGLKLPLIEKERALARITANFGRVAKVLFFVNVHTLAMAQRIPGFRRILQEADFLLNDGVGLSIASRIMGTPFPEDLPGNIIIPHLFMMPSLPNPLTVFLLGGQPDIVAEAVRNVSKKFPNIKVVGSQHGYFSSRDEMIILKKINACRPHILLVGLGNPKQEFFISRYRDQTDACLIAGVGGLIDIWGGRIRDYPRWATRYRLHWLCRLCQEPRRLAYRYLVEVPHLLTKVLYRKIFSTPIAQPSRWWNEVKPSTDILLVNQRREKVLLSTEHPKPVDQYVDPSQLN